MACLNLNDDWLMLNIGESLIEAYEGGVNQS